MTSSAAVSPASSLPASPSPLLRGADLALLLVAIVWGTSYGVAKGALAYYPVLGFLAVRFLLTTALLAPVALRGTTAAQRWGALRKGLPLGALLLSIFVCETYGVAHTPASRAAFLISLCVVFTPVAEWALMGQRPSRAVWMCVAVSLCGALLLAGGWQGGWSGGDALMLAAAVLRALMACATARAARHVSPSAAPGAAPAPVLLLTTVQSAVVGLGTLAMGWALLPQGLPPLPTWAAASGFWWAVPCSPWWRKTGPSNTPAPAAWACSPAPNPPGARCLPWPGWAKAWGRKAGWAGRWWWGLHCGWRGGEGSR